MRNRLLHKADAQAIILYYWDSAQPVPSTDGCSLRNVRWTISPRRSRPAPFGRAAEAACVLAVLYVTDEDADDAEDVEDFFAGKVEIREILGILGCEGQSSTVVGDLSDEHSV